MNTYRKILAATDFSSLGNEAVRVAYAQAWPHESELIVCHVLSKDSIAWIESHTNPSNRTINQLAEAFMMTLIAPAERKRGVGIRAHVISGEPVEALVSVAQRERVELLVTGTHGRTGLDRILLGSVAEALVRTAPCSVLVVR